MPEYDIFISYRRSSSGFLPRAVRDSLLFRGYSVFLDVESMHAGGFDRQLLETIRGCKDFILVLSPGALDRCVNKGDWLRMEIACALAEGKNIIPLVMDGFGEYPETLPEDIADLPKLHALRVFQEYYDPMIDKLCGFLTAQPRSETGNAAPAPAAPTPDNHFDFIVKDGVLLHYVGSDADVAVPEGITEIGCGCFEKNSMLRNVRLPAALRYIGDAAFSDTGLTHIEIPDSVKDIGADCFDLCESLGSVVLPEGLTAIRDGVFHYCSALSAITLPETLSSIGEHVFGSSGLTQIDIPAGVRTIGAHCFEHCNNLQRVRLSRRTAAASTAFADCPNICIEYID